MKFRTELVLNPAVRKISHSQQILSIGSCFADEVGKKLTDAKFSMLSNPFGTIFHPLAIENALARILH
ncbi:MAG: GSCFA domain-containing protein [Weeksellaceae bacterium]|nr:GSCFA domain-containing protein [Weeksellaceae bacterium]